MKLKKIYVFVLTALFLMGCSDDDPALPLADFQFLVEDTQVTFNGTVENADSISWDFGDGGTSTDEDPVYAYSTPGTYAVVMTVSGGNGSFSETKEVTILPSLEILLTGGVARPEGKSWRLSRVFTTGKDGAGPIAESLPIVLPSIDNLLQAVGLGSSYDDTFTFVNDGTYIVDNRDGQSLTGLLFASAFEAANITAVSADINNVPLAHVIYTPTTEGTWAINEEDFTVDGAEGSVTFSGRTELVLNEYLGFRDLTNTVILKEINETTMNVAIAIHTVPEAIQNPTLFFHLSFDAL
ncbi:MAG: PKD domain-containing protein [Bacteroidota bacterium]